jgi:starch phosphorylase
LSEQISTAGMEASGTGNMKLALNGALTIGTLDGANVEIRERVGDANIFIFGMTAEQVAERRSHGLDMTETVARSSMLQQVLDSIGSGVFSPGDTGRFAELIDMLRHHDQFLVTADFDSYVEAQQAVATRWRDAAGWWRSSALNTAHMAFFSSDRAMAEYADEIWRIPRADRV